MIDPRLRIPLDTLWPELADLGLPIWVPLPKLGVYGVSLPKLGVYDSRHPCLDLSRPGASDILARRVATACGCDVGSSIPRFWFKTGWTVHLANSFGFDHPSGPIYWRGRVTKTSRGGWKDDPNARGIVPTLADLDPTDDTRLDWGNLGSPRVVDLVALGLVAQHLFTQEQK